MTSSDGNLYLTGFMGSGKSALATVLADCELLRGSLIVSVALATDGTLANDHTARTPGDTPIVSATARRTASGELRVALSGVAATPVVASDASTLSPPSDFRGSIEYRRHLANVLIARVTKAVSA